ncbi:hypothetical protein BGW38_001140 [Lunasporangiospora selenospora]|uniref:RRM domain-containing protein n=1 Tax=Lunasporangiospora selenospora TaxID=979761 RepID=A0A9P6FW10_9FUNG|nr:hypothetical protein BGW38_001140 [Lunasporangiospora selenospora]
MAEPMIVEYTQAAAPEPTTAQESNAVPAQNEAPTPSPTLYIKNLNEKTKLEVLKKSLRTIFGQYGKILEITAHSNIRMRGQAFVAFEDLSASSRALAEIQGFPLYGKQMMIQYAKNKSDIHAKKDGDYEEHYQKRVLTKETFADDFKPAKRQAKRLAKQRQLVLEQQKLLEQQQQALQQQQQLAQQALYHQNPAAAAAAGSTAGPAGAAAVPMIPDEYLPRNSILFLQSLPQDITEAQLVSLFQQYPGFKEVRMVPGRSGIAFVEYDNEYYSAAAKTALADYQISPENKMKVTFARK